MRIWTPKIEYKGRFITILLKNLFISHKINIPQKGGLYLHISLLFKTNCGKENIDRLKQKILTLCLTKDIADRIKRQATRVRKILVIYITRKVIISIIQRLHKSKEEKITKPPNWQGTGTQIHRRNNSNKYMKYVEPQ